MIARIPLIAVIAELRRCNRPGKCLAVADSSVVTHDLAEDFMVVLKAATAYQRLFLKLAQKI